MKNNFPFFIILIFLFSSIEISAQCSMCRAVLKSEEAKETAEGINNGILYLMAIPYILVALVCWKVIQILKKE